MPTTTPAPRAPADTEAAYRDARRATLDLAASLEQHGAEDAHRLAVLAADLLTASERVATGRTQISRDELELTHVAIMGVCGDDVSADDLRRAIRALLLPTS